MPCAVCRRALAAVVFLSTQSFRCHLVLQLSLPSAGLSQVCCLLFSCWRRIYDNWLGAGLSHRQGGPWQAVSKWTSGQGTKRLDRRVTGANVVDEPLQELLSLFFRDFCECWYGNISDDPSFLVEVHRITQAVLIKLSQR